MLIESTCAVVSVGMSAVLRPAICVEFNDPINAVCKTDTAIELKFAICLEVSVLAWVVESTLASVVDMLMVCSVVNACISSELN